MPRYKHTSDEVRVLRAIARMPYGALVSNKISVGFGEGTNRHTPQSFGLAEVAEYLEILSATIADCTEGKEVEIKRLRTIESDVEAMRRLLSGGGSCT